jgi:hypothetical protein
MLTKESILNMLKTNDKAVCRALVVLNERQTADEQASENTRYHNGRGFRPCHAKMGTSMAKFYTKRGYLSPKQIAYWRMLDKSGAMRIGIYWAQLLEEAEKKAATNAQTAALNIVLDMKLPEPITEPIIVTRDFGNDMEHRMILAEMAQTAEEETAEAANKEIDEIDAFWEKIRSKK